MGTILAFAVGAACGGLLAFVLLLCYAEYVVSDADAIAMWEDERDEED